MPAKAHVAWNHTTFQVGLSFKNAAGHMLVFPSWKEWITPSEGTLEVGQSTTLNLDEEEWRAIYEALAEFFGHGANDVRSLRKDYDHERARVDKFINALLKEIPR